MSVEIEEMIYRRNGHIYICPYFKEYDVTDHVQELVEKLEELRRW